MRIVHVVRQFYPSVGGLESVVLELARWQVAHGHAPKVVTLNHVFNTTTGDVLQAREIVFGVEVVRIPFVGSKRYPLAPSVIGHLRDADVVHVHGIDFFFDYLAWTKPFHRRPLVVSTHGGYFHTSYARSFKRLYFATVTRASLTWYEGIAAVSQPDFELFSRRRRRGIICIGNGIDSSKYAAASASMPTKSIIYLGRLSTNKRLDRLVSFLHAVRQLDPDWGLQIVGRPWDVGPGELMALADRLNVHNSIQIQVSPTDAEIRATMGKCSVAAIASDYEGFGLAAVECLSAGLFPVLSDIPAFRYLLDSTGIGLLVDFSKPGAAARQFLASWEKLVGSYADHRLLAVRAATQFDWSKVCTKYEQLYRSACGKGIRSILDVPVRVENASATVASLDACVERGDRAIVAFANAHTLNVAATNEKFRNVLRRCVVLNDGVGVDIASRILYGSRFPENLNGTDFIPRYLRETTHQFRIFLLGSKLGIAERAGARLSELCPEHRIAGCYPGYFAPEQSAAIADAIRGAGADLLLVGMGNPHQELWLDSYMARTKCRLAFSVGALFDFLAGEMPRASPWIRAARLEWVYRLSLEPRRLAWRYVIGNPLFLLRVARQWSSGSRVT